MEKCFKMFCSQSCSELQRKLCRCQGVTMEFSLLFLKRYQRHFQCCSCWMFEMQWNILKHTFFKNLMFSCSTKTYLTCTEMSVPLYEMTWYHKPWCHNSKQLRNGNRSSIHIWNHRMSFSCLQLVIFSAVIKKCSPDITSIFEFTDSFMSPTVFYIKFLYNFRLHAAIILLLREKTCVLSITLPQTFLMILDKSLRRSPFSTYIKVKLLLRLLMCSDSTVKGPSKYHK